MEKSIIVFYGVVYFIKLGIGVNFWVTLEIISLEKNIGDNMGEHWRKILEIIWE
jgi:hypothetical protein